MLIGNRDRFAIELTPVAPSWERRYAPEATAWAGLAIWVEGSNLSRHVRAGEEETREAFFVPLAPLADWIVRHHSALQLEERAASFAIHRRLHDAMRAWGNTPPPAGFDEDAWLDARDDFWGRHFLAAGAEGARLPNVAFLREDDDVLVTWDAPGFAAPPRVDMLHPEGGVRLSWHEVSRILLELAAYVADAFLAAGVAAPYPWMTSGRQTWGESEPARAIELYCGRSLARVAEVVGLDSQQVESLLLAAKAGDPGASPFCQVVRDLPPDPSPAIGLEIRRTVEKATILDPGRRTAWLDGRAIASDAARAGATPEEQGQLAARALRDELGADGQPIDSVPDTLSRFGVDLQTSTAQFSNERMVMAGRADGGAAATILPTRRTATRWGRRFEEARALGHALLDAMRQGAIGAASTRWAQDARRRRSGAFAAELLLPSSALEELSHGVLDGAAEMDRFGEMLERYGVGARTAANQLYNQRWLSDWGIRDELIERFGHREG
jgi:hypothetical protein